MPQFYESVPEFIDPVFTKTRPKRSFSVIQNEGCGLIFAKTGSIISGTGQAQKLISGKSFLQTITLKKQTFTQQSSGTRSGSGITLYAVIEPRNRFR